MGLHLRWGKLVEGEILHEPAVRAWVGLDGVDAARGAHCEGALEGGEADVGADVDHGVTGLQQAANEDEIIVPVVRIKPELPGKVGRMQAEPEVPDGEGDRAAPASAPKKLREEKADGLGVTNKGGKSGNAIGDGGGLRL